jgi:hypothetical protein
MEREAPERAERAVGRLIADEQPLRPDEPEPIIERPENRALSSENLGTKADYRKRNLFGKGIIYVNKKTKASISAEQYAALPEGRASTAPTPEARATDKHWWSGGGTLTEAEATELYEPLIEVIKDDGGYLDKAIALKNPKVEEEPIWGNLTDDEAQILAELLLKGGRKSPRIAATIRISIEIKSYAAALAILAPRIQMTAIALRTAPQATRPPRRLSLFRPMEAAQ